MERLNLEFGCYLDNHRGWRITQDAVKFLRDFLISKNIEIPEQEDLDEDDENYLDSVDWNYQELEDIINENFEFYGIHPETGKKVQGYIGFNDGDWGIYPIEDE